MDAAHRGQEGGYIGGAAGGRGAQGVFSSLLAACSPRLNGYLERAQATHRYEFYEAYDLPWTVSELRPRLREWEWTYNLLRPHQALDNRTPAQYLKECHPEVAPPDQPSHMY